MATKGFPELKQHYAMLGVPDLVMAKVMPQFGHNYNYVSREVMYHWFNKYLRLGLTEPILEEDYKPLSIEELTVWDSEHPKPPGGGDAERALTATINADSERQIAALAPRDSAALTEVSRNGWRWVRRAYRTPIAGRFVARIRTAPRRRTGRLHRVWRLLRNIEAGEELPVVFFQPKKWNKRLVIWVDPAGKSALYGADGRPTKAVQELIKSGATVAGVDLLYQGEFLADGKPLSVTRRVANPREFAGYTWGYNPTLFAQRVHDLLTLVSFCRTYADERPRIDIVGVGAAALGRLPPVLSRPTSSRVPRSTPMDFALPPCARLATSTFCPAR